MRGSAAAGAAAAPPLDPGQLAAPWFDAVRDAAARVAGEARGGWPSVEEIDRALAPVAGVGFVAAAKVRRRRRARRPIAPADLYEIQIASRRQVPTRERCVHDLLNALAWAAFPAAKWALSTRLAEAQRARLADQPATWRLPGWRTRAHDRLALLDEGGILIAVGRDSQGVVATARALVFGHALLEHALAGDTDVWGAAIALPVDPGGSTAELCARVDAALAAALSRGGFLERREPWPRLSLADLARRSMR